MQAFTPFVQVTTYATRHFATLGLAPAAANHFFSLSAHWACKPVRILCAILVALPGHHGCGLRLFGALVLLAAWAPSMAGWFYDYVLSVPIIANTLVVFGDLVACSVGAHMGWCQSFGAGPIILAVHPRVFDGPCWPGAPPRPLWTFS